MIKRRGKILISGFSNSGKSTLINTFLRKKISIVSHKVQTTNQKIRATLNYKSNELIFIDTPGIITTKKFFNKMLSRATYEDLELCDINLFVIDSVKQYDKFDDFPPTSYPRKTNQLGVSSWNSCNKPVGRWNKPLGHFKKPVGHSESYSSHLWAFLILTSLSKKLKNVQKILQVP